MPTSAREKRAITILVAVLAASLIGASAAHGAFGDPHFQACITGKESVGPPPDGNGVCEDNGFDSLTAQLSGFSSLTAIAVSNDGLSVYAAALGDDAIARFSRDPSTGALTYLGCLSGNTDLVLDPANPNDDACDLVPTASSSGTNSGLNEISDIAVTPDDESVYVTAQNDDAVGHFDRDTTTGELDPMSFACVTGKTEAGQTGSTACEDSGTAESGGTDSGLDGPQALAVTDDSVYAVAPADSSIVQFDRDPTNPGLSAAQYVECQSPESETLVGGTEACIGLPNPNSLGANTGMDSVSSIDISPDGESVYTAAFNDHAVTRFARNPADGELTFHQCITGELATAVGGGGNSACENNGHATTNGLNSGLQSVSRVEVGPDNTSIYATLGGESGVARFSFDPGADPDPPAFEDCITGEDTHPVCTPTPTEQPAGNESGLRNASAIVISDDGKTLYTTSGVGGDDAVGVFDRDPTTGELDSASFNCITGELASGPEPDGTGACAAIPSIATDGTGSGLEGLTDIAATPDGKSIYGTAFVDASVFQLHRENPPDTTITSGPANNTRTADSTPTFNFSAQEPLVSFDSFECSVDTVVVACTDDGVPSMDSTGSHTTGVLPDGAHSFSVRAFDTFGFPDPTPASRTNFTVDTTDPQTTITSGPAAGSRTADRTPTFGFSSSEGNSTFQCRFDSAGFQACNSGSFTAGSNLSDGTHSFEVKATDQVGNADLTSASRSFTVDATGPETTINSGPAAGSTTDDATPTFGFSSSEPGSSFRCRIDGGGFQACNAGSFTPASLSDGAHTLEVIATDGLGNADPTAASRGFTVDTENPNTSIKKKPKKTVRTTKNRVRVTFRFKSDESGSEFECKLDKRPWKDCKSPKKYKVDEGKHTFKVRATDEVGHTDEKPAKFKWTVKER